MKLEPLPLPSARIFIVLAVNLLLYSQAAAQGTVQAITTSGDGRLSFINGNGVGWTFTPATDITVVSVGPHVTMGGPYTVDLWEGTNAIMASYVAGSNQLISPVLLSANHPYAISLRPSAGTVLVNVYGRTIDPDSAILGVFEVSPFLSGFGNFLVSPSGSWSENPLGRSSDFLYFGAAFQFQAVPEASGLSLFAMGSCVLLGVMTKRRKRRRYIDGAIDRAQVLKSPP